MAKKTKRKPRSGARYNEYDYIVASDVVWAPIFVEMFLTVLAFCVRSPRTKVIVVQKTRDEQIDEDLQRLFPAFGFRLLERVLSTDAVRATGS